MHSLRYLVIGGLTLDDIVAADGTMHCRTAGGNALYSALGAVLWTAERVGVLSFAGADYPAAVLGAIERAGVDLRFVARPAVASIRLHVSYEPGGGRQISYQDGSTTLAPLGDLVAAAADELPRVLRPDGAAHLAALPVALQRPILEVLRSLDRTLTLDSIEAHGTVGGDLDGYRMAGTLAGVTAFLPSEEEFRAIAGEDGEVPAVVESTLAHLVVKRGGEGADLFDLTSGRRHRVPVVPVDVVDPTGAGDAFCGGFLVGLAETGDPVEAALRGTVSASFAIEAVGGVHLCGIERAQAQARLDQLRAAVAVEAG